MKKSCLPVAFTLLLLPQILISQDAMDIASVDSIDDFSIEKTEKSPKSDKEIAALKTFELESGNENGLKVLATFAQIVQFELRIFNKQGLEIYKESFETDDFSIAIGFSTLPEGDYFMSLKTKDGEIVRPLKK